jgi:hypothetical protein
VCPKVTLSLRTRRYGSRAGTRSTKNTLDELTIMARREARGASEGISSSALQRWDSTIAAYWPDLNPQHERPYQEAAEGTVCSE